MKKDLSKILKHIFAEVANVPSAIGYLPSVPFANGKNERVLEIAGPILATAATGFGIMFAPAATIAIATPLYIIGRIMQGLTYGPTPAQKLFKLDK